MTVDAFLLHTGILGDVETTEEQRELLASLAQDFLRCGGSLSLSEFHGLSSESREAFRIAGDRLDAALANTIALALIPTESEMASDVASAIASEQAAKL